MSIEILHQNNCIILSAQQFRVIDIACVKTLFDEIKKMDPLILNASDWVVVSLPRAGGVDLNAMQILCRIAIFLEKKGPRLAVIVDAENGAVIKANNIDRMVSVYPSLDVFYKKNDIEEVENIKFFLETLNYSVFETMKVLTQLTIRVEKLESVHGASIMVPSIQAGATAGIISAHFSGSVTIGFNTEVYRKLMSRFLEMEVTELTDEMNDGGSELLNVVLGQVKMALNEKGFNINQVIPTSIFGEKVKLTPNTNHLSTLIRYHSEIGDFVVLFSANPQQKLSMAS